MSQSPQPSESRKHLSDSERDMIIGAYLVAKAKPAQIATALGFSVYAVKRVIARWEKEGTTAVRKRSGRPPKLSERYRRALVCMASKNRRASLRDLTSEISKVAPVSERTVSRSLHSCGLRCVFAIAKPCLTSDQAKRRLAWARFHQSWQQEDWDRVIWSDESSFQLIPSGGRVRVWRRKTEKYRKECLAPTIKHGGGSVTIWGCFRSGKLGPLVVVVGAMDQVQYVNVLSKHLIPFYYDPKEQTIPLHSEYVFQEDNASAHTGEYATWWKRQACIDRLDWPPQSPDLNPIEHLWEELGRRVRSCTPRNLKELASCLVREWSSMPSNAGDHLVKSMKKRVAEVIAAKGYQTKY